MTRTLIYLLGFVVLLDLWSTLFRILDIGYLF